MAAEQRIPMLIPLLEGGIRNVNFFNGRVLTAEDLQEEQQAHRRQHRQLGQVLGEGVVKGLEVRLETTDDSATGVVVEPGLAINRKGQVLSLPRQVKLDLRRKPAKAGPKKKTGPEGGFAPCAPAETALPTDTGAYILVAAPASGPEGRAPKVALGDGGVASHCDSRYVTEGVQFRLERVDVHDPSITGAIGAELPALLSKDDPASTSKARNLLAHLGLGTGTSPGFVADLFRALQGDVDVASYGPLDGLRARGRLTECDVPLAVLLWEGDGLRFVDIWSVRRRVHTLPAAEAPPFPATDRRAAEAEAAFLQFQDHMADLMRAGAHRVPAERIRAVDYFRFLPAAGVVPLAGSRSSPGVRIERFFDGVPVQGPVFLDASCVRELIAHSFAFPSIDLEGKELVRLYRVGLNTADRAGTGTGRPQPYLIFSTGHLPYRDEVRYNLSRWNYSSFPAETGKPRDIGSARFDVVR